MSELRWLDTEYTGVGYPDCYECCVYLTTPGLIEACASVGITLARIPA